jgi:hypothetical protein
MLRISTVRRRWPGRELGIRERGWEPVVGKVRALCGDAEVDVAADAGIWPLSLYCQKP